MVKGNADILYRIVGLWPPLPLFLLYIATTKNCPSMKIKKNKLFIQTESPNMQLLSVKATADRQYSYIYKYMCKLSYKVRAFLKKKYLSNQKNNK